MIILHKIRRKYSVLTVHGYFLFEVLDRINILVEGIWSSVPIKVACIWGKNLCWTTVVRTELVKNCSGLLLFKFKTVHFKKKLHVFVLVFTFYWYQCQKRVEVDIHQEIILTKIFKIWTAKITELTAIVNSCYCSPVHVNYQQSTGETQNTWQVWQCAPTLDSERKSRIQSQSTLCYFP